MGAVIAVTLAISACTSLVLERPLVERAPAVAPAPPLAEAWRYDAESAFGPAAALAVGDRLVVVTRTGEVHVLDAEGKRVGKAEVGGSIEGAPALVGGRLLVVPVAQGRYGLVGYDVLEGRARWRLRDHPHAAGLLLAEGTLVAAALDGTVRGLDPATGAERWTLRPDTLAAFHASPIALGDGRALVADDRGRATALEAATGRVVWTADVGAPVYATPAVGGGRAFVPTTRGALVALDAATGTLLWTQRAARPEIRFATPATTADAVVVGASDGRLVHLDAATGGVRWTFETDGHVAAAPLVAGGVVYAGTLDERLVAVDLETGALVWEAEAGGRVKSAPAAFGPHVVVLAEPHHVRAFRATPPVSASATPRPSR